MIATSHYVKCPKCSNKDWYLVGDVRPYIITCKKCGHKWNFTKDDRYFDFGYETNKDKPWMMRNNHKQND